MRADDIRKDQMRYKEIEPNGISPNSTALGHDQPLWLPLVYLFFSQIRSSVKFSFQYSTVGGSGGGQYSSVVSRVTV